MKRGISPGLMLLTVAAVGAGAATMVYREARVGDVTPRGVVVPTGKTVAAQGLTATVAGAVVDAVVSPDGKIAAIKSREGVALFRLADGTLVDRRDISQGTSLTGIAFDVAGTTLAASTARGEVLLFPRNGEKLSAPKVLSLPPAQAGGAAYPCGLAFGADGSLLVAANRDNSLLVLDPDSGTLKQRIPVDPAPYSVLQAPDGAIYVSCWARTPTAGAPTANSSGTPVQVDARGSGTGGSVCRVDLANGRVEARASVPAQPTEMAIGGGTLLVACANGDAVVSLEPQSLAVRRRIPMPGGPGAAPNGLCVEPEKARFLVACGGLDRVLAYRLSDGGYLGSLSTAWYPTLVRRAGTGLLVATAKGIGSRSGKGPKHGVYDLTGTISYDAAPRLDPAPVKATAVTVAQAGVKPVPIPLRTGEPSVFEHVVYVIKENRTYDQVLGDMKEGNGDPSLVIYGENVTPNHHALAREFALLDNYYCNGINSADGHAWTTEANATTYFERAHGGWTRSYPFGDDPLATSESGHIWDNALEHAKTIRNFGEYDYASPVGSRSFKQIYDAYLKGEVEKFNQNIGVERLRVRSERDYPGWNLGIPDVVRADRFVRRLRQYEREGEFPNLSIVYLPQDHTSGGSAGMPTPRAHVADNDLALGRVVEAISRSRFWAKTAIFVVEDDPQDGFDHVDGHRSVCLVISPYSRARGTISRFYNQAAVVHTMEQILGLPPMNLHDAESPLMTACFGSMADLHPYVARAARVPLDELNKRGTETAMLLDRPDQVREGALNRTLWRLAGKTAPYPKHLEGAHGKGLIKLGLRLAHDGQVDGREDD